MILILTKKITTEEKRLRLNKNDWILFAEQEIFIPKLFVY